MVHLMKSAEFDLGGDNEKVAPPVKVEFVEDPLEDKYGSLHKRSRTSSCLDQQWSVGANTFPVPPSHYNPLEEPSPLGLRLRKSPSLLDLIQMKLSQGDPNLLNAQPQSGNLSAEAQMDSKGAAALGASDKMKASNFPASLLRIGQWEYKSRYEGDLVAKCYFAKHKLVWEVLEGGLKSKVEIQWSDIMALKAHCPENGPSTLNVVLSRQPLFFRETNPQPRKHTLWQATSDFTDGQASVHRQHFLECQQGLLAKHFEKLIQCDTRLGFLSQQPEIILDSPLFDTHTRPSIFEDLEEPKGIRMDNVESGKLSKVAAVHLSPVAESLSSKNGHPDFLSVTSNTPRHIPSFLGNVRSEGVGMKASRNWDQIKLPGLHPSMSMSDLMNHIGHCLSEQMGSCSSSLDNSTECQDLLEDIAQYLLSDSQAAATTSDEKSLMARVNSLCSLLQKDVPVVNKLQPTGCSSEEGSSESVRVAQPKDARDFTVEGKWIIDAKVPEEDSKDAPGNKQSGGMSRKDSFGELLMRLPRITSLPKFLFNISEEDSESNSR